MCYNFDPKIEGYVTRSDEIFTYISWRTQLRILHMWYNFNP